MDDFSLSENLTLFKAFKDALVNMDSTQAFRVGDTKVPSLIPPFSSKQNVDKLTCFSFKHFPWRTVEQTRRAEVCNVSGSFTFLACLWKVVCTCSGLFKQDVPDQPGRMEVLLWSAMGWEDLVVPYSFSWEYEVMPWGSTVWWWEEFCGSWAVCGLLPFKKILKKTRVQAY